MVSLVMGCKSGSTLTSWQTSVRTEAVKSLISLCLIIGKAPLGQERACSTENLEPHTHVVGKSACGHPTIPESDGIPECALVEVEPILLKRTV